MAARRILHCIGIGRSLAFRPGCDQLRFKAFERWFPVLLIINQAIAAALFVVVSAMAFRLIQNVRNRVFGAKMTARLALTVAGMVLIPCALIYFVSSVFISRSIDSWFDVRVEKALDSGVTITRGILTEQQQQIEVQAQHMASLLTNTPVSMILPELLKQLENRPNQEALVFYRTAQLWLPQEVASTF